MASGGGGEGGSGPLYHLVQQGLWEAAVAKQEAYTPPTYQQDGFTHATAKPELLLGVANHFYTGIPGAFLLLVIDPARLEGEVKFEPAAPVGEQKAHEDKDNSSDGGVVLFPHIYSGIHPRAVTRVLPVVRDEATGAFLRIDGV